MKPRNFRFAALLAIFLAFALPSVQAVQASARTLAARGRATRGRDRWHALRRHLPVGRRTEQAWPQARDRPDLLHDWPEVHHAPHQAVDGGRHHGAGQPGCAPLAAGSPMPRSRPGARTSRSAPGSPRPSRKPSPITYPRCTSTSSTRRITPPNQCQRHPGPVHQGLGHIHALAAKAHLNVGSGGRLRWALILMHMAYFPASQRPKWSLRAGFAANYWPGAANVNVVAADGYNRGGCRVTGAPSPRKPRSRPVRCSTRCSRSPGFTAISRCSWPNGPAPRSRPCRPGRRITSAR